MNMLINLDDKENLKFAIYNAIRNRKGKKFTIDEIVEEFNGFNKVSKSELKKTVTSLVNVWLNSGQLQEHLDSYSMIV